MANEALGRQLEQLAEAALSGGAGDELEHYVSQLAPDVVIEYPQTRERLRGRAGARRALEEHPSPPRLDGAPRVTVLGEDRAAIESHVHYGDEPCWIVSIMELRHGLIQGERDYFAEAMPPASWRAAWVVPIPSDRPPVDPGGHQAVQRDVVERYFRAQSETDLATLTRLRHRDWVHDQPQYGERFPSPASYVEAHAHYPGGMPALAPIGLSGPEDQWVIGAGSRPLRVSGQGAHWVGETLVTYPSGERWFDVLFMDFREGRVVAERSYWCRPFEIPDFRAGLNERF
jgi:hypothetical protein